MRVVSDSKAQGIEATGKAKPVMEWIDTPTGRKRSDQQARNPQTGMHLWDVECMRDEVTYGEEETARFWVTVGHETKPEPKKFSTITFNVLIAEARVNRKSGQLIETWTAEAIDKMQAAPMPSNSVTDSKAA